jgi:DNA-binding NarL/FixJ family response regulator
MSRVLVIDDDAGFRVLARKMLTASGLTVIGEAENVAAGSSAAEELKPDAALVDVMLPDGDGVALARELAALPWEPRVLLTSSSPDAAAEEDFDGTGVIGFVPKSELPAAPLDRLLGG